MVPKFLSQEMLMSGPGLNPSPRPTVVADLQQLILGGRSRNMLSEQFFIYTKYCNNPIFNDVPSNHIQCFIGQRDNCLTALFKAKLWTLETLLVI